MAAGIKNPNNEDDIRSLWDNNIFVIGYQKEKKSTKLKTSLKK